MKIPLKFFPKEEEEDWELVVERWRSHGSNSKSRGQQQEVRYGVQYGSVNGKAAGK